MPTQQQQLHYVLDLLCKGQLDSQGTLHHTHAVSAYWWLLAPVHYADMSTYLLHQMGRVRVRQHVNPLRAEFQVRCWVGSRWHGAGQDITKRHSGGCWQSQTVTHRGRGRGACRASTGCCHHMAAGLLFAGAAWG
jgi:hypothetical protein